MKPPTFASGLVGNVYVGGGVRVEQESALRARRICEGGSATMSSGDGSSYCRMLGKIVMSNVEPIGCADDLSQGSPCNVHVWSVFCHGVEFCHALSGLHPPHVGRMGSHSAGQAGGRGAAARRG